MKAEISNKRVFVHEPDCLNVLNVTDVQNIAYCLAHSIYFYGEEIGSLEFFRNILKKQKSVRAVVQKFNSICKALEL